VVEVTHHRRFATIVLERFVGVTLADVLAASPRLLPVPAWRTLALEVLAALAVTPERRFDVPWWTRARGVGWSLSGALVLSFSTLNDFSQGTRVDLRVRATPPSFIEDAAWSSPARGQGVWQSASFVLALLCGRSPFARRDVAATMRALMQGDAPLPSSLHPQADAAVDDVFLRAFRKRAPPFTSVLQVADAVRGSGPLAPRDEALAALWTLCAAPLGERLLALRSQAEWLPAAWDGLYPPQRSAAEGLAVFEDALRERLGDPSSLPTALLAP
jgi:hypothetical protein